MMNRVRISRFPKDKATLGSVVVVKNSVTKLSTDLQHERDRVKMIEDNFDSLKVELVHASKKYLNFVADSSNDNWDLFRGKLHQIFTSVGVNPSLL